MQVSRVAPDAPRANGGDGSVSDDVSRWPTGRLLGAAARGATRDWASDAGPAEAIATRGLSPAQVTLLRDLLVTMITAREGTTDDEAGQNRT